MFRRFRSQKQQGQNQEPVQAQPQQLLQSEIRELLVKVNQLEEKVQAWALTKPEIKIENFYVQNPTLESLTFKLDSLTIKELSGALNLGNNFGLEPPDGTKPDIPKSKLQTPPPQGETEEPRFSRTSKGYKVRVEEDA